MNISLHNMISVLALFISPRVAVLASTATLGLITWLKRKSSRNNIILCSYSEKFTDGQWK